MNVKSATGTIGHLLWSGENYFFRVYKDGKFTDYDVHHCDLEVKIMDKDAAFYEKDNGKAILDHSPETLGKTDVSLADVELPEQEALKAAVSAIYFDDNSDFKSALWAVVKTLAPNLVEDLAKDPQKVWKSLHG